MNPLEDYITDKNYELLSELGIINKTAERDYIIRQKYKKLKPKMTAGEAFGVLETEYSYLTLDTIRKIVYQKS